MMYLLTMGWFLAHTSLAMTPEHSATNGGYSSLRSARAGHSKSNRQTKQGRALCMHTTTVNDPSLVSVWQLPHQQLYPWKC